jgi:putative hydrolase of the HAD superfamily
MRGFDHINTWVFDLDNTLYPASCKLFDQMHVRMSDFIKERLNVDQDEALRLRREYYLKHGTTLRGLMLEHDMEPADFLDYVHDIDYTAVANDAVLQNALEKLPGRKLVFTNGTTDHAGRVMKRLGVEDHFEAVFDIVDSEYIPKPARGPYDKFAILHSVDGTHTAFFEDLPENLQAPHAMGMTTVLITSTSTQADQAEPLPIKNYIDHTTSNLPAFLSGIVNKLHGAKQ